jgi:hypothetical protein
MNTVEELKKLSEKRSKAHQQPPQQNSVLQRLSNSAMQAIDSEVARLVKDKEPSSAPPPVPSVDWTQYPFYSHTLTSWNLKYPPDQMNFYLVTLASAVIVSKALWRSWNIRRAMEITKTGVDSDMLPIHRRLSGLTSEELREGHGRVLSMIVILP